MSDTTLLPWSATMITVMRDLASRVSSLQASLPVNAEGLPAAYINAAVVLEKGLLQDSLSKEDSDASVVHISFLEGFPTVDGLPLWERLEGEVLDYYDIFKSYRNMKDAKGSRSLAAVADIAHIPISHVHVLAQIYHWSIRVKAYDMYKQVEFEAERQRFVKIMESKHRTAAEQLFKDCIDYMKDNVKALQPKDAIKWLEMAVKLERLSLGLDPEKPYFKGENGSSDGRVIFQNYQIQSPTPGTSQTDETTSQLQEVIAILTASGALDTAVSGKPRGGASGRRPFELVGSQDIGSTLGVD